jgi:ferric-dicitrate binding protein FerR (iron transport regulator)
MNKKNIHTDKDFNADTSDLFSKVNVPYEKSKEEVWQQLAPHIEEHPSGSKTIWMTSKIIVSIAASLLILFSILSVMRFYTKTVPAPNGQHLTVTLPDGSTVDLNAHTTLTYHPFWWQFSRTVGFEGEGLFHAEKGKKFEVISKTGRTVVLGTIFNIYSRDKAYQVSCLSGSVKVISNTKQEAILSPDYHAEIDANGNISVIKEGKTEQAVSWINNIFTFTSAPLQDVISEIERQYNVRIRLNTSENYIYTGFFSRNKQLEDVLDLLSKTFNFTIIKRSNSEYEIIQTASE